MSIGDLATYHRRRYLLIVPFLCNAWWGVYLGVVSVSLLPALDPWYLSPLALPWLMSDCNGTWDRVQNMFPADEC